MDERFDCIIVGGGPAGLAAAMTLARADVRFLLVERGEWSGAKADILKENVRAACNADEK